MRPGIPLLLMVAPLLAQTAPDPALLAEIGNIRAIDNHGHPLRVTAPGEKPDDQYDALIFEEMEPFPLPVRIRPENPEYIEAWRLLYGYPQNEINPANVKGLLDRKRRAMEQHGDNYPAWVLDKLGIEIMLANRIEMGRGLTPPRFRWVSFIDALMFPLSNERARRSNPDYRSFYVG